MANEQERKKLARLIYANSAKHRADLGSEVVDGIVSDIIAAGYQAGPRLPDPGSPEEAEAVERMAQAISETLWRSSDTEDLARAALHALRGQTDE